MNITFTPEQKALQREVRDYMSDLMTDTMREEMKDPEYFEGGGPEFHRLMKKMPVPPLRKGLI